MREYVSETFEYLLSDGHALKVCGWGNIVFHGGSDTAIWTMELPCGWKNPAEGGAALSSALHKAQSVIYQTLDVSVESAIKSTDESIAE